MTLCRNLIPESYKLAHLTYIMLWYCARSGKSDLYTIFHSNFD